ncbi:hypothetical protein E4U56_007890 [Claviceps arundinis]|uniref:ATP-dependent DNA helicase PIF1 n=1 Tax=Claviceps arundinis TaxID=1623583 RepID=A0A9P7MU80_9HYPO|nr:hypothetical protein E4U56_007890 [Claviceps arundinis]
MRESRTERTTFEERSVYLFATRASVFDVNYSRLREANVPVLLLRAWHSNPRYASILSKEFNDLTVMLMANIWTEAGLYTSSTLPCDIPGAPMPSKVVPIFPCRRYRTQNTTRTSTDNQWREQFPLTVSYAMTIHKSQGMTLDLAILDLKGRGTLRPYLCGHTLDDIRPNVTRALEIRWLDEARRAPQILLPPAGLPTPRTPDLLTPYPLTFSTGASTGRRGRERDREGTPTPWGK